MRLLLALALLAGLAPGSATAQPAVPLRLGAQAEWSYQRQPRGVTYRVGDIVLEIRPQRDGDLVAPRVTVRQGGHNATMTGQAVGPTFGHKIGVGLFNRRGVRFVYFQSFSGGAHCCNSIQVALVRPGEIRVVDLGDWDGDYGDMPRDRDGDGMVDFVQVDNAFLYGFASYAESFAPPVIHDIIGDRPVDVSARPGFRPLFRAAMNDAGHYCRPRGERSSNGACAAYVAAAARAGQFDIAWARVLRSYDRNADWDYPTGCRVALPAGGECPAASVIRYRDYPAALRAFLVRQGYIRR
jgi:hypothetical protein